MFVSEYLVDLNGTRAYQVAFPGCSYGSARALASKLIAKVNIAREIRAARAAQQRRTQITAAKVLREIARVAFSDVCDLYGDDGQFLPLREVPLETRRAIASVKASRERVTRQIRNGKTTTTVQETVVSIKLADKNKALEKLCRHLGLQTSITPRDPISDA